MTTIHETNEPPQYTRFDALLAAVATSKVDLIEELKAVRALAISRGDNAASYRLLAEQVLHAYAVLLAAHKRDQRRIAELRETRPDADEYLRTRQENEYLRMYAMDLRNELDIRDGVAA